MMRPEDWIENNKEKLNKVGITVLTNNEYKRYYIIKTTLLIIALMIAVIAIIGLFYLINQDKFKSIIDLTCEKTVCEKTTCQGDNITCDCPDVIFNDNICKFPENITILVNSTN